MTSTHPSAPPQEVRLRAERLEAGRASLPQRGLVTMQKLPLLSRAATFSFGIRVFIGGI